MKTYHYYEGDLPEIMSEEYLQTYFNTNEGLADQRAQGTTFSDWMMELLHMQILVEE